MTKIYPSLIANYHSTKSSSRKIITFRERDTLNLVELHSEYDLSTETYDEIIKTCTVRNGSNTELVINFVGVAATDNLCFEFLPKIFPKDHCSGDDSKNFMRLVVQTLKKYNKELNWDNIDCKYLRGDCKSVKENIIAHGDWLIQDYLSHGIYKQSLKFLRENGHGLIDWPRTIEKVTPIFSLRGPVYPDLLTNASDTDSTHLVARLHHEAVIVAERKYGYLLGYAPFRLDHEPVEPLLRLPSLSRINSAIRLALHSAYDDRNIRLLKTLLGWYGCNQRTSSSYLNLYGVDSFHTIWESVCKFILRDQSNSWNRLIPKPYWISEVGSSQFASDTFRPDVITTYEFECERSLIIADAKYYKLYMPPKLSGQPGVNDIAKQLWYDKLLNPLAKSKGFKSVHNCFLFPCFDNSIFNQNNALFELFGKVYIDGMSENSIQVFFVNTVEALEMYVHGIHATNQDIQLLSKM